MKLRSLLILLLIFCIPFALSEEAELTVSAPSEVSGTFTATVDIDLVNNFDSIDFYVLFDDVVISLESVEAGDFVSNAAAYLNKDTYKVLINLPGDEGKTGSGNIAKLNFKAIGNEDDQSQISLSNVEMYNIDSDSINISKITPASINVVSGETEELVINPTPKVQSPGGESTSISIKKTREPIPWVNWFDNIFAWVGIVVIIIAIVWLLFFRKKKEPIEPEQPTYPPEAYPQYPQEPQDPAYQQQYQDYEQPQYPQQPYQ